MATTPVINDPTGSYVPLSVFINTNTQTGATYTVLSTDSAKTLIMNRATGQTVTLPNNLAVGWNALFTQIGAGATTLSAASGATINGTSATVNQYDALYVEVLTNGTGTTAVYNVSYFPGGALPLPKGGTGLSSYTQGDTLYASSSSVLSALAKDTNATRYLSNTGSSNNPAWAQVNIANGVSGILASANGGAGSVSGVMKANGSGTTSAATAGVDFVAPGTSTAFTAQQNFALTTLTDAATISWDVSINQVAQVTLGGNRTLANPTNLVAGGTYILIVTQDATGTRTLAYGANYKWPGGTVPVLSAGAGAVDILTFISNGTNLYGVAQYAFA